MRFFPWLPMLLLPAFTGSALAGVPVPRGCFPNQSPCGPRCTFLVEGQGAACQFRFRADGGLDRLTVVITLRDAFDLPTPGCSTSVTLRPTEGTLALCACGPWRQGGVSDAAGALALVFSRIGGRGQLELSLTTHCQGDINWFNAGVPFTSPDLDGSCEETGPVGVIDLGRWASALPPQPYRTWADFDCSGSINVIDLGYWATGLGVACGGGTEH